MLDFLHALSSQALLRNAALAGALASIACGIVGSYVVVKRIAFIGGGIAHAVLGGMGIAYFFGADPLVGAVPAALLFAVIIGWVSLRASEHEDTLIGALWAVGMAIGILFVLQTPGYAKDLRTFLFGNILLVTTRDVWIILVLDVVILGTVMLFYKGFMAVCFDEEFARLQGVRVEALYILLLCLISVSLVILVQVVGVVMVIALLTLPAAVAAQWVRDLRRMMVLASVLVLVTSFAGLAVAYPCDWPAGATIVLVTGLLFLASSTVRALAGKNRRAA